MGNEKAKGPAALALEAAAACLRAARGLRAVVWELSQVYSVKGLMPPEPVLARVDELKRQAESAARVADDLLRPLCASLALLREEPVVVGRVTAASWHEAAAKLARVAGAWPLGTARLTSYFASRLDAATGRLGPLVAETAAASDDTELHHLMATLDHKEDEIDTRLQMESARLCVAKPEARYALTDIEARVVAELRRVGPMKAAALAKAVYRSPNGGSFRAELANMVRRGLIRRGPGGYEAVP